MSTNKKSLSVKMLIMTALIIILSSGMALAQEKAKEHPAKPADHPIAKHIQEKITMQTESMLDEIKATPEQKAKIDAIKKETKDQMEPLAKQMHEKRKEMMDYVLAPDAKKEEAIAKQQAVTKLYEQIAEEHINSIFKMKAVLTPEQQKEFLQLHNTKMEAFKKQHAAKMEELKQKHEMKKTPCEGPKPPCKEEKPAK